MMKLLFFDQAGKVLFERTDDESASVVHEEMNLQVLYPYDPEKVIRRGMRIGYQDMTGVWQLFEIRKAKDYEPDHYQEITAEHICISELTDEHFGGAEWTNVTATAALTALLNGTGWSVGTDTSGAVSSGNASTGDVWQNIRTIENNWNVYILPRVTVGPSGITGKYMDILPAGGTWRGLRLSLEKNADEMGVTWDDSNLKTALYAYGKSVKDEKTGESVPLTFTETAWPATADHPAKPAGQAYLEDPDATAAYGRNGRPRFGYYQNGDIGDAETLLQKTWETLKTLNHPDVTINGLVCDLYRLGLTDVPIRLHDMALVEIRPTGVVLRLEICQYTEDLNDPTQSRLTIGTYIPNIIYINKETSKKSGAGGGSGGQSKSEYEESLFRTRLLASEYEMTIVSEQVQDVSGEVAEQAAQLTVTRTGVSSLVTGTGAVLNPDGSLVLDAYGKPIFTTTGGGLYSHIDQNAEAIRLRVIKGDVATQLAVECGNVHVTGTPGSANLTVDGYVTSTGLQSEIASLAYVEVNKLVATSLGDDEDTIETGYIDSVISESVSTGTLSATTVTIGSTDLADAVYSFGTPTASGGQISIPWTKVDGTAGTPINFNIADTAYYQSHVGIQTLALNGPISQPYQEGEYKGELTADRYYQAVATPKDGSAQKFYFKTPAGSAYTEYIVTRTWASYTPGTTYSTRRMTIKARGKKTDGTWEDLSSSTFTVTGSYQTAEAGGHELIISSY